MTGDPRTFIRKCNIVYVLLALGCAVCFVVSFLGGEANMLGFPILFLLAAVFRFFTAWLRFRRDIRGKNQKAAGFFSVIMGILLLVLSYAAVLNVW